MRLIFDSGSQRSYISESAKRLLSLRVVGKRDMCINTFGSSESKEQSCPIVRVNVEVRDGKAIAMRLLTIPLICESMTGISFNQCLQDCEHLQGLSLADDINDGDVVEFDLLVGLDYYWQFLTGETIKGRNGPTAVYSKLGWLLSGPVTANSTALITHVLTTASQERSSLGDQLCKFWDLEALGIKEEESTVYDQFSDQVKFNGTRYEVSLPWKDTAMEIPSNYELSLRRLNSLMRRLKRDPSLLIKYNKIIEDQISNGIVEVVVDPMKNDGDRIHYLPHHAVIRQDKQTTKVRVVYDASAKDKGLSLNDCLHVGPKFDQGIFELLLRFRVHKYAFTADVEKAFLMIAIEKSDRDALRFLWVKDIWQNPPEILVLRFARVTFGVAPSPFLLNATIRYHIERYRDAHPLLVKKLARSMYVDDVVSGAATAEEVIQMYEGFKDILKEGGFNLRKFVPSQLASAETTEASGELSKVLGIPWNPSTDELVMDLRPVVDEADSLTPTKRHVVSIISRVYDPMGIVSPVVVRLKIFLQELHNAKIGWDEHIPDKLLKRWNDIVSSIKDSEPIVISRCYLQDLNCNATKASLCGFCDASTRAYAAVVYMLCEMDDGVKKIAFVSSKTRVAPLKEHSIPRLELLGALLLARLMSSVSNALKEEIKLGDPVCYTDSLVALYWIKGVGRSWKPFVDNRVREIRGLVPVTYWKHCSGDMNPADAPSRGLTMHELLSNKTWLQGPNWLTERDREFEEVDREIPEDCVKELRADEQRECGLLIKECEISKLISIEKYGSLERLLRVTAYMLQFVSLLKKVSERECFSTFMARAELFWVKESQSVFKNEVKFQSEKRQLQLFTDTEGVWRCGGRILNADVPYSTKHPVLLPGGHYFTSLVVLRSHQRVFHNGVRETLSEVRAKYWIMRGRSVVKKILRQCVICRKAEGRHYSVPDPPPLPAYRVTEKPPFTSIGVDFAGPLYIRRGFETSESKAWLCLYTCCVTRAIHLDLLTNMSLEYFFRSFRRFVARRGLPERVISDNAKTFKGASKIFKEIMNHRDVEQYLEGTRIQWNFNVEKAPWWGGIFERLIRSVKRCLRKVIGRARLTYDELLTIIVETEMIINSRPLSYVSSDDLYEAITPSHLINGRRLLSIPDNFCRGDEDDEDFEVTRTVLTKRMKFIDRTLTQFWNRWRAEYLLELREAHRYGVGVTNGTEIAVGDIVVVHSDEKRRGFWNLAKVEETIIGKDGNIRGAVIRVFTGGKHSKLLRRPIQRLYPLEVKDDSVVSDTPASVENDVPMISDPIQSEDREEEPVVAPENRSRRAAASEARDKILAYSVQ